MKYLANYADLHKDKYTGYFVVDPVAWYTHVLTDSAIPRGEIKKRVALLDDPQKKIDLVKFIFNDACANFSCSDVDQDIVGDIAEHHFASNFVDFFVVDELTDMIPQFSRSVSWYSQLIDKFKTFFRKRPLFNHTQHYNYQDTARCDLVKRNTKEEVLNPIEEHAPVLMGKVIVKRAAPMQSYNLIHNIIEKGSLDFNMNPSPVNYFAYEGF
jgi:hypothetical protein